MKMQPEKNYGVIKYSRTFTILIEFSKFHQMLLLLRITQQLHVNVLQCTTRGFVDWMILDDAIHRWDRI